MKTNRFLSLPVLLLASAAMAQTVSEDEALDKALQFFAKQSKAPGMISQPQLTLAHKAVSNDETCFYVFNNANGGYVLIGADEVAHEVLGYSDRGTFDADQLPDNMRAWLQSYEQEISTTIKAKREGHTMVNAKPRLAKAALPTVAPLLGQIEWDQDLPYNAFIPGNTSTTPYMQQYATGCVATATAQVMKYYNFPDQGVGSKQFKANGITYKADFGNTTYQWSKMKDSYNWQYTGSAEENAVATLMYHVGVSIDMDYGTMENGGSGAYTGDVAKALTTYFRYDKSTMQYLSRWNYSDTDWENLVRYELVEGRPIIYRGGDTNNPESGHCFVCDGCDGEYFHINWGWSGSYNDYFLLTPTVSTPALAPNGTGSGGSAVDASYASGQEMVIGIQPDPESEGDIIQPEYLHCANDGYIVELSDLKVDDYRLINPTSTPWSDYLVAWLWAEFPQEGVIKGVGYFEIGGVVIPAHDEVSISFSGLPLELFYEEEEIKELSLYGLQIWTYPDNETVSNIAHVEWAQRRDVNYKLSDAGWGTLCLPYDAEKPEGMTLYKVNGLSGDALMLQEANKIEMQVPYLVKGTPDTYQFTGPDTPTGTFPAGLLHGTTEKTGIYAPQDSYVLQNLPEKDGLAFYHVSQPDAQRVKACTAYLEVPAGSTASRIRIEGTTAIEQLATDEDVTAVFNLLGQPAPHRNGLIIENGKLNFVK